MFELSDVSTKHLDRDFNQIRNVDTRSQRSARAKKKRKPPSCTHFISRTANERAHRETTRERTCAGARARARIAARAHARRENVRAVLYCVLCLLRQFTCCMLVVVLCTPALWFNSISISVLFVRERILLAATHSVFASGPRTLDLYLYARTNAHARGVHHCIMCAGVCSMPRVATRDFNQSNNNIERVQVFA